MAVATMPKSSPPIGAAARERLSLGGDLRAMPLDDVLLWVASRRKTGTLHVERGEVRKLLVFEEGALQYGSSSDPREKLGQLLVQRQLVSELQLRSALRRQEHSGIQLGILLVSDGALSSEQLCRTLRAKAEQIAHDLFLWEDGSFVFQLGALRGIPLRANLDTLALIEQGKRRRERARSIREAFGGGDITFVSLAATPAPADRVRAHILELATAGRTLAEIVRQTPASEFDAADYLLALCELKVLRARAGTGASTS
jgi:hypothetical protein